uniref:Uncharacterized protein n=1 Tax=Glossina austeni TaxID=7395 RepID=A0A1A9UFT3_GLOAU
MNLCDSHKISKRLSFPLQHTTNSRHLGNTPVCMPCCCVVPFIVHAETESWSSAHMVFAYDHREGSGSTSSWLDDVHPILLVLAIRAAVIFKIVNVCVLLMLLCEMLVCEIFI